MLFDVQYESDPLGRIARKVETTNGTVHIYVCNYSISGYLERVSVDGVTASSYGFDLNGNRTSYSGVLGNRNATYDAQDRMLTYGGASYLYNANGELTTRTEADTTTRYEYDLLGNLKKVILSNGKVIEYIVDGNNRRIGKKVNGVMVHTWMYESQLCPAAEYDGAGNLIARFIYGTKVNVPEYMVKNGVTYRIITDHLGSVRYVVETSSGEIAQSLTYYEYGLVLSDNNPGLIPSVSQEECMTARLGLCGLARGITMRSVAGGRVRIRSGLMVGIIIYIGMSEIVLQIGLILLV